MCKNLPRLIFCGLVKVGQSPFFGPLQKWVTLILVHFEKWVTLIFGFCAKWCNPFVYLRKSGSTHLGHPEKVGQPIWDTQKKWVNPFGTPRKWFPIEADGTWGNNPGKSGSTRSRNYAKTFSGCAKILYTFGTYFGSISRAQIYPSLRKWSFLALFYGSS